MPKSVNHLQRLFEDDIRRPPRRSVAQIVVARGQANLNVELERGSDGKWTPLLHGRPVDISGDPVSQSLINALSPALNIRDKAVKQIENDASSDNVRIQAINAAMSLFSEFGFPPEFSGAWIEMIMDLEDNSRGTPNPLTHAGEAIYERSSRAYYLHALLCVAAKAWQIHIDSNKKAPSYREVANAFPDDLKNVLFPGVPLSNRKDETRRRADCIEDWSRKFQKGTCGPPAMMLGNKISFGQLIYNVLVNSLERTSGQTDARAAYLKLLRMAEQTARSLL